MLTEKTEDATDRAASKTDANSNANNVHGTAEEEPMNVVK
jgi:hypothetical protein